MSSQPEDVLARVTALNNRLLLLENAAATRLADRSMIQASIAIATIFVLCFSGLAVVLVISLNVITNATVGIYTIVQNWDVYEVEKQKDWQDHQDYQEGP